MFINKTCFTILFPNVFKKLPHNRYYIDIQTNFFILTMYARYLLLIEPPQCFCNFGHLLLRALNKRIVQPIQFSKMSIILCGAQRGVV